MFGVGTTAYIRVVGVLLRGSVVALLVYGGLLGVTYFEFTHVPTGFVPQQDKGYLLLNVQLPDSSSVQRTREMLSKIETMARKTEGVEHTVSISGQSLLLNANAPNLGSMYVMLKEFTIGWACRPTRLRESLRDQCQHEIRDALVGVFGAPPIDGLGPPAVSKS